MSSLIRGVIHGRTIELAQDTGLPEGQVVAVSVQPISPRLPPGDGLRRSAGTWAEDARDLDEYLDWNRQQRKRSRTDSAS